MSIGTRIKQARKAAGLSQQALCQKIGVKQPTLSQLESGDSSTTVHIGKFADALGVNALWLETGRGSMTSAVDPTLQRIMAIIESLDESDRRTIEITITSMANALNAQKRGEQSFKEKSVFLDVSGKKDKKAG